MKRWPLIILLLALLACSLSPSGGGMGNYGPAGELYGDYWYHVTQPLTLNKLHGKVILVGVWQFT